MKPCIVIADDDAAVTDVVSLRLGLADYEVVTAGDAAQAMAMVRAREPAVVILDVHMPGGGFSALAQIKADPDLRGLPVMMLTGERSAGTVMQAMDGGADDYMIKPFHPDRLLERVSRLMASGPRGASIWKL